jgi:opacity protein-like surface antigen
MKKLNITLISLFTTATLLYAGGDSFVEPIYETEDIVIAEEAVIEEYPEVIEEYVSPVEEYIPPVEEYVESAVPLPIKEIVVQPVVINRPMPVSRPSPIKDVKTNGLYAGIGISTAKFKTKCKQVGTRSCVGSGQDKTAGIMGRVGYDINQYIGVEARGVRTNWKSNGGKVKHAGVFLKPMIPTGDSSNIYALAGVAKTTTQGHLQRVDTKSFAWGAGVEYDISLDKEKEGRYNRKFDGHGDQEQGLGVFADYERLVQKSGSPDLDTVNVGLTYDF